MNPIPPTMIDKRAEPSTGQLALRSLMLVVIAALFTESYRVVFFLRAIGCQDHIATVVAVYAMILLRLVVGCLCLDRLRRWYAPAAMPEMAVPPIRVAINVAVLIVVAAACISEALFPGSIATVWNCVAALDAGRDSNPSGSRIEDLSFAVPFLLLSIFVTPFCEEVAFRAVALYGVSRPSRVAAMCGVSSAVFGLAHASDGVLTVLWATLWGAVVSIVFAVRRNVWPLIAGHMIWNAITEIPQWR